MVCADMSQFSKNIYCLYSFKMGELQYHENRSSVTELNKSRWRNSMYYQACLLKTILKKLCKNNFTFFWTFRTSEQGNFDEALRLKVNKHEFLKFFFAETKSLWPQGHITRDFLTIFTYLATKNWFCVCSLIAVMFEHRNSVKNRKKIIELFFEYWPRSYTVLM